MIIFAFFTENGSPKTGLTPTIDIADEDGTAIVTGASMTEVSLGFYKYDFSTIVDSTNYVYRADGGASQPVAERYSVGSNQIASDTNRILKVEKNNWQILNNQLIIYDDDGTTALFTFNLTDKSGNPNESSVFKREAV